MNVKISGFYDEVSTDLDKQIEVIKSLGEQYMCPRVIDGKNIASYTLEEFQEKVYPRLQEAGIKFSSIGSPIGKVGVDDEEGFKKQLAQLNELCKIARLMECNYIRIFSFFIKDGKYEEHRDTVMKKLDAFLAIAKDHGVCLLHENEKGIYGDNAARVKDICDTLHHPLLKFAYDASNFIQVHQDPWEAYQLLKDDVVYYHMKDCDWETRVEMPLGTGDGHYGDLFSDLKARNYQGFMTLEPHTGKYAVLKRAVYFTPFLSLILRIAIKRNFVKAFRKIDKALGVGLCHKMTREDMFRLQYKNLKLLLED